MAASKQNGGDGFLFWNARNDYAKPFAAMPEMAAAKERYFGKMTGAPANAAVPVAVSAKSASPSPKTEATPAVPQKQP